MVGLVVGVIVGLVLGFVGGWLVRDAQGRPLRGHGEPFGLGVSEEWHRRETGRSRD